VRQGLQTDGSFRNTASDLTADLNHRFRSYDRQAGNNPRAFRIGPENALAGNDLIGRAIYKVGVVKMPALAHCCYHADFQL
jgi:hypothetical protein